MRYIEKDEKCALFLSPFFLTAGAVKCHMNIVYLIVKVPQGDEFLIISLSSMLLPMPNLLCGMYSTHKWEM